MSEMHRFWSIYEDSSCDGAPTGVFVQRRNDCESQVASSGASCVATFDDTDTIVGYVDESCYNGRVKGFNALFDIEPFMAYDYYYDDECIDYENSAAYRASGECETLYDGYTKFRSAIITSSDGVLSWRRNMGNTSSGALNCAGPEGEGYNDFQVPLAKINTCQNVQGIDGGFVFYNLTAEVLTTDTSSAASLSSSGSSSGQENGSSASTSSASLASSTSSSSSSSSSSDGGVATGTILGLVGGIAVLLVVIIGCFWKKRSKRAGNSSTNSMQHSFIPRGSAWTGGPTDGSEPSTFGPGLWNDDIIIATHVPRDQVTVHDLICRGGFGEIYRGTYNNEAVAVKMLFPEVRSDLRKVNAFLAEAKLMAGLVHPHIVRFVGVSWGSLMDLCLLTELMKGGDLRALMKTYEAQGHPLGIDHDKIRIAYHVAQALTYLHSLTPIVIHRDLKSKNILLTEDLDAKITDFGVSRERQENTMTAGVGTMLWMAPEVMMAERYDEKADIFSFGVLLSELDLQSLPYSHARVDSVTGKKIPDAMILQKVASGALQVSFSRYCVTPVVELAKECVALDPSARPSAPMVVYRLQTIMKEFFEEGYLI